MIHVAEIECPADFYPLLGFAIGTPFQRNRPSITGEHLTVGTTVWLPAGSLAPGW